MGTTDDDRSIALWAITGHEGEPETWAGRVAWVKHQVAGLVADSRPVIQKLADELYRVGAVRPSTSKATQEPAGATPANIERP